MFQMQGRGLDRTVRRRHGGPRRLRFRQLRPQKGQRLRVRYRHRSPGNAEVRDRRHPGLLPKRCPFSQPIPMTLVDAKERFSTRVADYVRYRPGYPREVLTLLREKCGLLPGQVIADIGSGTGLLSELFLKNGNRVYGVEPNKEMRAAGEEYLASYDGFNLVDGSAESTTLGEASIDFITAGQSFHWFDHDSARREFARILNANGWMVILWNDRRMEEAPFTRGYEAVLEQFGNDYKC